VKMAPVVSAMRDHAPDARHWVIHTGQHYDREMAEIFVSELGMPEPDFLLGVGSGSHGVQTARALEGVEDVLASERPDLVVVQGDVNSTLAAALAAAKLQIPVAHIEAGLRSFDRTMPEELNRLLVDQISTWCFTHSPEARDNLTNEGIDDERIFEVGNTMIDTLVRMRRRIAQSDVFERLGLSRPYLLVTLHRPSLVDGPLFEDVLSRLDALTDRFDVVFPVHPRSRARLPARFSDGSGLRLIDPVGYIDFLALEEHALGVLTDSGGVQEETTFLGVPCFTLRTSTERPITLVRGTNRLLGLDPAAIDELPALLADRQQLAQIPDGWDGRASHRVAEVLMNRAIGAPVPVADSVTAA
jgi:UDP-N-acetylglucosamine 2-epimerase (non-hydrolysing)